MTPELAGPAARQTLLGFASDRAVRPQWLSSCAVPLSPALGAGDAGQFILVYPPPVWRSASFAARSILRRTVLAGAAVRESFRQIVSRRFLRAGRKKASTT
jgi:hypothetical protein